MRRLTEPVAPVGWPLARTAPRRIPRLDGTWASEQTRAEVLRSGSWRYGDGVYELRIYTRAGGEFLRRTIMRPGALWDFLTTFHFERESRGAA